MERLLVRFCLKGGCLSMRFRITKGTIFHAFLPYKEHLECVFALFHAFLPYKEHLECVFALQRERLRMLYKGKFAIAFLLFKGTFAHAFYSTKKRGGTHERLCH